MREPTEKNEHAPSPGRVPTDTEQSRRLVSIV